jgi:hypothetical protein
LTTTHATVGVVGQQSTPIGEVLTYLSFDGFPIELLSVARPLCVECGGHHFASCLAGLQRIEQRRELSARRDGLSESADFLAGNP